MPRWFVYFRTACEGITGLTVNLVVSIDDIDNSSKRPPITKAIDVWAVGVTLFCLIFGRCPFMADTEFELFDVIPKQPYVPQNVLIHIFCLVNKIILDITDWNFPLKALYPILLKISCHYYLKRIQLKG